MRHAKTFTTAQALTFAFLALLPNAVNAQTPNQAFSLVAGTSAFMLFGEANEYVYNQNYSADYMNSLLYWPLSALACAGASLELSTKLGLFADLSFAQAFSGKAGTMGDSDFLNGDGVKTHYSESDSYVERLSLLDLSLGWDFPVASGLTCGAFGAFSYADLKLSARDGYSQYPADGSGYRWENGDYIKGTLDPWKASTTKVPIYGTAILYEQSRLAGSLGLRARWAISDAFSAGASFAISPTVSTCTTADNHELRTIDFTSDLSSILLFEPRAWLEFSPYPRIAMRLSGAYRFYALQKGNLSTIDQGITTVNSSGGYFAGPDSKWTGSGDSGAELRYFEAGLSLRLSL